MSDVTTIERLPRSDLTGSRWSACARCSSARPGCRSTGSASRPPRSGREDPVTRRSPPAALHDEGGPPRHYPFGLFAVPMDQVVRIHASSGTTGKPTVVGYTREDLESGRR